MRQKITTRLVLMVLVSLLIPASAFSASPLQTWQLKMTDADSNQSIGEHNHAVHSFMDATALAEKQKLPAKYVAIPLCGLIEEEVLCSQIEPAEANFAKLIKLIEAQSRVLLPDPQVNGRISSLADGYQDHQNPKTREICLKNACLLKMILFGESDKHCTDCMSILANYYIEHGKIDDGVRIITSNESAKSKASGKKSSPSAVGDLLNLMAINYRTKHQYDLSNQLELAVIKLANKSQSQLSAGLPAFYTLLGMNALAQGKNSDAKTYFAKALKECPKIKVSKNKQFARPYIDLLVQSARSDGEEELVLAEAELRQLLELAQNISTDPRWQYGPLTLLPAVLAAQHKPPKPTEDYLLRAISIANLSNSYVAKDLSDLYMRLGIHQASQHKIDQASNNFTKAIALDKETTGFHTGLILLWWSGALRDNGRSALASEKLTLALTKARALSPETRGTLLADLLVMLGSIEHDNGRVKQANLLFQQSSDEIQLQRKIRSKVGPDLYHRLSG